ncbi:quinone oxidoreductase-like isoform X2 [Apostichopus japonicus]|uniref:quinone oxidoreductase-like isoform X2 n=1 Tax=Stichopus japonicus TaxID=307972 RepID=UPI003AB3C11F
MYLSKQDRLIGPLTMRAIRVATFGGPEVLQVKTDVTIPQPADNEVLVNIKAAGVNPVETYIRAGVYKRLPPLPFTPGSDGAGVVDKVGSKVKRFKPGDRVFLCQTVSGSYAEYGTVNECYTHPLTAALDFKQGAALGVPYFTAYRALCIKAKIQSGQSLLIHGASGSVGIACIQLARSRGLTVYGTAGSQDGLDLIKKLGVHHAFNHREEGYEKRIMETSKDKGVDCIVEMLSNVNLQKDLDMVSVNGTIVVIGSRGNVEISPRSIMAKEANILGVMLWNSSEEEMQETVREVVKGTESGELVPVIGKEYTLEEASQAHFDIVNTKSSTGRLVLIP